MADANLVSQPPLTVAMVDQLGRPSKAWAIWFRDLYKRTSYKGGNAIDEMSDTVNALAIIVAAQELQVQANAQGVDSNQSAVDGHIPEEIAHGSNGEIIGNRDYASQISYGLVRMSSLVADATESTATITQADATAAGATYNQAQAQSVVDLANANKAGINTLVSDVNSLITLFNGMITATKSSGQMTS